MARVDWDELPRELRTWAEGMLGARVKGAVSQQGGFSPGAACRLALSDGGRAFLKAVSASVNPDSPKLHRREAEVAAALPDSVPVPRFIASYDDGDWVALLFQDVDGRHPAQPWQVVELDSVLAAVARLHEKIAAMVAGIAGYFTYQATLPPPPGLLTIRKFQEAQAVPARAWLARLTGWA